jgi:formate dehydrogenase subunit delta
MSNLEHLVRQANRIGLFFEAMPNRDDALEGIATHILKFWAPSLRSTLLSFLEQHPNGSNGTISLSPLSLEALVQYQEKIRPHTHAAP